MRRMGAIIANYERESGRNYGSIIALYPSKLRGGEVPPRKWNRSDARANETALINNVRRGISFISKPRKIERAPVVQFILRWKRRLSRPIVDTSTSKVTKVKLPDKLMRQCESERFDCAFAKDSRYAWLGRFSRELPRRKFFAEWKQIFGLGKWVWWLIKLMIWFKWSLFWIW